MKIIDISRELISAWVYPGDPAPHREILRRIEQGDMCNLSAFYSGCHSATHLDAPLHFVDGGETIDQIPLDRFYGPCTVVDAVGLITGEDIDRIIGSCRKKSCSGETGKLSSHKAPHLPLRKPGWIWWERMPKA